MLAGGLVCAGGEVLNPFLVVPWDPCTPLRPLPVLQVWVFEQQHFSGSFYCSVCGCFLISTLTRMKSYPSFFVLQLKFNFSLMVNGILSAEIFGSVKDFMALNDF